LNEYCPNGHNVPLVRSRDGALVCCCDDPACPYKEKGSGAAAAAPPASAAEPAASASAPGGYPSGAASSPPVVARRPEAEAVSSAAAPAAQRRLPAQAAGGSGGARAVVEAGATELVVQGADLQFCCTRLAVQRDQRAQLLGGSFAVRIRCGVEGSELAWGRTLREALVAECRRLMDRVLLPERAAGVQVTRAAGQVMVACGSGARFEFPDRDCVALPVECLAVEELAALMLDKASGAIASMQSSGVLWIEASLTQAPGAEAIVRRSCA